MHASFSCLHCHRTDLICVTYEQKIRIGSHLTDSVNEAYVAQCDKNCALTDGLFFFKKPNYFVGNKTNILHRISNVDQFNINRTLIE